MEFNVLLNFNNKLGKSNKMQGLPSILSRFRNELNKFYTTGERMLDYIYHDITTSFEITFGVKMLRFSHIIHVTIFMGVLYIITPIISLPDGMSVINNLFCLLKRIWYLVSIFL